MRHQQHSLRQCSKVALSGAKPIIAMDHSYDGYIANALYAGILVKFECDYTKTNGLCSCSRVLCDNMFVNDVYFT